MFAAVKTRAWVAWTTLLVFLLTSLSPAGGLVLCIGEDGHVAIELATADTDCSDCADAAPKAPKCCSLPAEDPTGCTCSDIPLPVRSIVVDNTTSPKSKLPAIAPACLLVRALVAEAPSIVRGFELRSRVEPPPCSRVPLLLTLRV